MFQKVTFKSVTTHVAVGLISVILCSSTFASFKTLSQRLPESSNAVVAVNVAKMVESPYGKKAEWGQRLAEQWAKQPMMIPPGAQQLIMAADVKPSSMESTWELSLIAMDKVPSVEELAKDEGGHIDRVWDKPAVASPVNAYFVPLENNVLASITPAERSVIARWVRQPIKPEGNVSSPYIKTVLEGLSDKTDIVMAMDLEGAVGLPTIRKRLDESEVEGVTDQNIEEVARILATLKGITLQIDVTDKINGKATIAFDRDTMPLVPCAKSILITVLNNNGMSIDELPKWTAMCNAKEVTMQGELSGGSLKRLLSIVQSPIPAATVAASANGAGNANATPAEASQKYFKMVCAILDNAKGGAAPSQTATWIRTASKRIEQLPILNVDPALVEWGGMVTTKLKQASGGVAVAQTQMNARVAGVADPGYSDYQYSGDGGSYTYASNDKVAQENAKKQRRQAALEVKAQGQEQALRVLNEIAETRPTIRAAMVEKYKIEF